ncbi:hypothetical protein [Desulfosporosinus sp. SB140]
MKRNHPSEMLNDLQERQEHQYDLGLYLGGKLTTPNKVRNRK